jgi:hypothetical protein
MKEEGIHAIAGGFKPGTSTDQQSTIWWGTPDEFGLKLEDFNISFFFLR